MLLFNRYEYNPRTDLIGKGDFSRVYKALDQERNVMVALKIYKSTGDGGEKAIPETERISALDHPNICRYLQIEDMEKEDSFGDKEVFQVCILEWMDGGNIGSYHKEHPDETILRKLLQDVIRGLGYLHTNGIIHRHVKASNILIRLATEGPAAGVGDFGIGKRAASDESGLITAVHHLAPEQLNVKKYGIDGKLSYNIDYWSLGVGLYELMTGGDILFRMGEMDSREQIMNAILSPGLPEKIDRLPEPFRALVEACLVKDAKERTQRAEDLLALLPDPAVSSEKPPLEEEAGTEKVEESLPPMEEEIDEDATVFLPRPVIKEEVDEIDEDATVLLPRPVVKEQEPDEVDEDATVLITRPVVKEEEVDEDATVLLPKRTSATGAVGATGALSGERTTAPLGATGPVGVTGSVGASGAKEEQLSLFNRYQYNPHTGLIGRGGFSRVYKAFDRKLNRWVALKIYKTSEYADRYSPIAEIRRVVNLDHPNICRYLDIEEVEKENSFGEKEITQICVMELLDGGNFLQYFNTHKSDDVLKKLVGDVLNGLAYLHRNGIIHRDIKPANILIKETIDGPVAKITDFGISKGSDSVNSNSSSALVVSIPYMAPEQLNVKKYGIRENISYNLDLWSLGVTIYEVITGKVLFKNSEQDSSEQIMTNIMAPELPDKISELPQPFRSIVSHCIIKNANERAQKAEELTVLLHSNPIDEPAAERPSPIPVPIPVSKNTGDSSAPTTVLKTSRASFFIEKPDEETVPSVSSSHSSRTRPANARTMPYLKLGLGVAAALIIVFALVYLFSGRNKTEMAGAAVTDSTAVGKKVVPAATPPIVTGGDNPGTTSHTAKQVETTADDLPKTDGKTANGGNTRDQPIGEQTGAREKTARGALDKSEDRGAARHKSQQAAGPDDNQQPYTLELTANKGCRITINNDDQGTIKAGGTLRVLLSAGSYTLHATSVTDNTSFTTSFEVKAGNLGQVGHRRLELQ